MAEIADHQANELDDVTVIIPCAGELDASLVPLVGKSSHAFLPLDGKPVICRTLQYLIELGYTKFVIPIRNGDHTVELLVQRMFHTVGTFAFPVPDKNGDVGYTILSASDYVHTSKALIVLGDTFFAFPQTSLTHVNESFVLSHDVSESYRWCLVKTSTEGNIEELLDKAPMAGPGEALIGVYGISDWNTFTQVMRAVWENLPSGPEKRMPLSLPLKVYSETTPTQVVRANEWYDCGHVDNLIRARKRLVQKRSFNELRFDEVCSTILKSSADTIKFLDEINYYYLLPAELQIFFPRVINANRTTPSLELEFYGYSTLSELLLFENLDNRIWAQIFGHIRSIQERFDRFRCPASAEALKTMYLKRVDERILRLAEHNSVLEELITAQELVVNGRVLKGIPVVWPQIRPQLSQLTTLDTFSVIHGDMCFSNILYDLSARVCKFIDPRGSFGDKGIYGDPRYDVAKLWHSIHGGYDFIVNDLFRVYAKKNEITLEVFSGDHIEDLKNEFSSIFFQTFDRREIELLEGILFLTMGVFHTDRLSRQVAMLATGIRILNDMME